MEKQGIAVKALVILIVGIKLPSRGKETAEERLLTKRLFRTTQAHVSSWRGTTDRVLRELGRNWEIFLTLVEEA